MAAHDLKIWPQYFEAVTNGIKTFEYRENDRGFQCGDTVRLSEYDPNHIGSEMQKYTGRVLMFKVGYVLPVSAAHVVFSLLENS